MWEDQKGEALLRTDPFAVTQADRCTSTDWCARAHAHTHTLHAATPLLPSVSGTEEDVGGTGGVGSQAPSLHNIKTE